MRYKFVCILALLLSSAAFAVAQVRTIPQPDDFLIDANVFIEKLPIIEASDEDRLLLYFNPNTDIWESYPYPPDLDSIGQARTHIQKRSDSTYLISPSGFWGYVHPKAEEAWLFDASQGSFYKPDARCGVVRSLEGEGQWIIVEASDDSFLCNTETGQTSPSIPYLQDSRKCIYDWRKPPVSSPDEKYVVVFCGGLDFSAYSYDVVNQEFISLGNSIPRLNENGEIIRWLSNTEAILHTWPSWNPPANTYYIVHVDQEDGLEYITNGLYDAPYYFDQPPRIEWMPCEMSRCGTDGVSTYDFDGQIVEGGLRVYNFEIRQFLSYPIIEGVNGMSMIVPNVTGDRLYRSVNDTGTFEGTRSAQLLRFNYETRIVTIIYEAEIEWIDSISPDGRYVALQMGHDGLIVGNDILARPESDYVPDGFANMAIIDLQTGETLYEAQGGLWQMRTIPPIKIKWIDEKTFLISGVEDAYDQIISLDGDISTIEAEFSMGLTTLSPDRSYLLNNDYNPSIYNIAQSSSNTLTQNPNIDVYKIYATWNDNNSLILRITTEDDITVARWLVAIPEQ